MQRSVIPTGHSIMLFKLISIFFVLLFSLRVNSQNCTTLGQTPSTAFPVCGIDTFSQSTVPYCGGRKIPGPCSSDPLADVNPFWYKFTCFSAGTLGFVITPDNLNDDYDWQIFDITGHDADEVYSNASLFVACNWSGNSGITGTSPSAGSLANCFGYTYPNLSATPLLKTNHSYLLLISHFTSSQNGYKLSFGGGSASITDTLSPKLLNAKSSCDAMQITVTLNKKMKCSSLATNGSDFIISPAVSSVTSASGIGCSSGFDMDSIRLTLNSALPPGDYTVFVNNGTDGNTLLDYCDRAIVQGNSLPLSIAPLNATPMDSLTQIKCSPQVLQLVFSKSIRCNSIATDGSDFVVTGTSPVRVVSAQGDCINGVSDIINVNLAGPIVSEGNYQVTLIKGSDGNTIIDECGQETPAGASLNFKTKDTVSADFTYKIFASCKIDTVVFNNDGRNGVNQWMWQLNDAGTSDQQNPSAYYITFGSKQITLAVSNGMCSDTVTNTVSLNNALKADFETNNLLCPEDAAVFINNSVGDIVSYTWNFGNGTTSVAKSPASFHYPVLSLEKNYPVSLIIQNTAGCFDTAVSITRVLKSCYIAVPTAFTPNGDGLNDYLYPTNAYKADNLEFRVYNRTGQLVFHSNNWLQRWDGRVRQYPQDSSVYVWTLRYTNHDTGKRIFQKGTSVLIR